MKFQVAGVVGVFVGVFVAFEAFGAILDGWVLSILWGWFMVPVFHLPPITIVPAIGIVLTIGFLTQKTPRPVPEEKAPRPDIEKMEREFWGKLTRNVVVPWLSPFITLFFGWVVHLFM